VTGMTTCVLSLGDYQRKVTCKVVKWSLPFDIVLGEPWLQFARASLCWQPPRMTVFKGRRKFTINPLTQAPPVPPQPSAATVPPLLSAIQFKRAMRKGHRTFLGVLQRVPDPTDDADTDEPEPPDPFSDVSDPVRPLLQEFSDVFESPPDGLPPDRGVGHAIPLEPQTSPPFRPMYRLSPAEREEAEKQLAEYLRKGWITPSTSPFGAPILFVSKKDGGLRMCIDYRALNKITVKNRYPLPRIEDLFDQLQGAQYFTSLDLTQGYHQIRISEEDIPKTAFRTPMGHFEFRVLCFGLTNAPATFQAVMNKVFASKLGKTVLVYLDDILIFSKTAEEHLQHVREVLELLRQHQLYAKISKCRFMRTEVEYLGHLVGRDGLRVDPKKVASVNDWPVPTDVHQLRSFLGLANYFRRFMRGYASVIAPLTALTGKNVPFTWTPPCQTAFEQVQKLLTSAPVLRLPDPDKPFEVLCDASTVGLGAVLLQEGQAVAYESRKLSPAETRYTTTEQELLAVVHALKTWRCYLEGAKGGFTVVTDHNPLTYFQTQPNLSRRQARWSEYLSRFHYDWEYRPGRINAADPLSRHPTHALTAMAVGRPREPLGALLAPVAGSRGLSPYSAFLQRIRVGCISDPWFTDPRNIDKHKLVLDSGLYWKGDRVMVPHVPELRNALLYEFHNTPVAGHLGARKTGLALTEHYWWPSVGQDIRKYCSECDVCIRHKSSTQKQPGLLQPLQAPPGAWESVRMDYIVKLPPTIEGHVALIVVIDRISKMAHSIPTTSDVTAEETARLFFEHVIKHHGLPLEIISDRDPKFAGVFWQTLTARFGTRSRLSTAFHPQTDGQTERTNRTLEQMLRMFIDPVMDDWDRFLAPVEFAYNNSVHESTGVKPFVLCYGRHPVVPASVVRRGTEDSQASSAQAFIEHMDSIRARAKELLLAARQRQKAFADKSRRELTLAVNSRVMLSTQNLRLHTTKARKFLPRWIGPYKVVECLGPVAYRLELPATLKVHDVFHVGLLKPYTGSATAADIPPAIAGDDQVSVHRIKHHRERSRGNNQVFKEYLVTWSGCGPDHTCWMPESQLPAEPIMQYWQDLAARQQRASGGPPLASAPRGTARDKQRR